MSCFYCMCSLGGLPGPEFVVALNPTPAYTGPSSFELGAREWVPGFPS